MPNSTLQRENMVVITCESDDLTDEEIVDRWYSQIDLHLRNTLPQVAIIDLSRVRLMKSSAISCLLEWRQLVTDRGGRFYLCGLNDRLTETFRKTRLDLVFNLYDSADEIPGI